MKTRKQSRPSPDRQSSDLRSQTAPAGQKPHSKRLLKPASLLAPVPVVMVSCAAADDQKNPPNILTVAWAGTICSHPPMVSISIRPQRFSYSLIRQSGEFVINLVDEQLSWAADYCGVKSGRDRDKFADCHLDAVPAAGLSQAPAIGQSRLSLSCRLKQVIPLGSHDLFLAEVVAVEAAAMLFDEKDRLCLDRACLVAYNHGLYQGLGPVLGFFGYSVAAPEVLARRIPRKTAASQPAAGKRTKEKYAADSRTRQRKKPGRQSKRTDQSQGGRKK